MGKMFNEKYYEVEDEEAVEDDKVTLGLLQENDGDGDLEAEMTKGFKQQAVEQANRSAEQGGF